MAGGVQWLRDPAVLVAGLSVVAASVLLAVFTRDHAFTVYDDAFIVVRYVDNLRAGCGLRFNCSDPPVEGFASATFLALSFVASFFVDDPTLVTLILLAPLALRLREARAGVVYTLVVAAVWMGFFLRSGGDVFPFARLAIPLVPVLALLALRGIAAVDRVRRGDLGLTTPPSPGQVVHCHRSS